MISCDNTGLVSINGMSSDIISEFGAICEVMIEQFGVNPCLNMFTQSMNVVEEGDNNGTQQSTD